VAYCNHCVGLAAGLHRPQKGDAMLALEVMPTLAAEASGTETHQPIWGGGGQRGWPNVKLYARLMLEEVCGVRSSGRPQKAKWECETPPH
jgi:hypothetical protein